MEKINIKRLRASDPRFAEKLAAARALPPAQSAAINKAVDNIITAVRRRGDAAVLQFAARFDGAKCRAVKELKISPAAVRAAANRLPAKTIAALKLAARRIGRYHRQQKIRGFTFSDGAGCALGMRVLPVQRAAVYAPGGLAAYPSSVLMGVIPAKIAGVPSVALATPPGPNGKPADITLAAAHIAGADEVWSLGGAQAVAAFALGTQTIRRADKIVGPGNAYVAEAKRRLFGEVGVDSIAGPSEVFIAAGIAASPYSVAADMLAQAEHDPAAQVIVASDAPFFGAVRGALGMMLSTDAREMKFLSGVLSTPFRPLPPAAANVARTSLKNRALFIETRGAAQMIKAANLAACEHVQVMGINAEKVAAKIVNAGALFIGESSPTALGDYAAGGNHILPTGGGARFSSPLGVYDFVKRTGIVQVKKPAPALFTAAAHLADAEGLPAHAASLRLRAGKKRRRK